MARCSCSTRRTRCSGPTPTFGTDADVLRVGTLSKTLGALGGFVAGPARYVELVENTARPYIFTTAPTPADTAAALAALRVVRSPEGDALVARLRGHVDRLRAGHPSPILPFVCGDEARALDAAAALLEHGLARARDPAADGRAGHVASARRALAPRTPTSRSTVSPPRCTSVFGTRGSRERVIVVVTGTGTEVGKTWVTATVARRLRDRGVARARVQAGAVLRSRRRADRRGRARRRDRRDRGSRVSGAPVAPVSDGAADGRRAARTDHRSRSPSSPPRLPTPADAGLVLVEGAGGVRSPLATDGDTVDLARACDAELVVLVADAGLGTINLVRLSVGALAGVRGVVVYLNRFDGDDELHRRNRDWLRTREGLEVVTDPEALARYVLENLDSAVDQVVGRDLLGLAVSVDPLADRLEVAVGDGVLDEVEVLAEEPVVRADRPLRVRAAGGRHRSRR